MSEQDLVVEIQALLQGAKKQLQVFNLLKDFSTATVPLDALEAVVI